MGLDDLIDDKGLEEDEPICPECGSRGEDTGRYENKCTSESCEVEIWYPNERN